MASSDLSRLQSPAAVQRALDEFAQLGQARFLARYGFGKSKDFLVRNPSTGQLCDSKAIAGVAYGYQFPASGPLKPDEFSGGEATVVAKLRNLGYDVVRIGQDWTPQEVSATVTSYFEMLLLEAREERFNKSARNAQLRQQLNGRTKASVELKHQNISAVLHSMGLPYITGYKPRGNTQLLLRQAVQQYLLDHGAQLTLIVDAMEEAKPLGEKQYRAALVDAPTTVTLTQQDTGPRFRLPRKIDYAARDASNRRLGRLGEEWALGFEQHRLTAEGKPELFQQVDWIADRLGDGTGYDILSYNDAEQPRYIEVKTTNGSHASAFIVSRNELEFAQEQEDAFYLYRLFQFRTAPKLYILRGDLSKQLHLEAIDYRATFRQIVG